MLVKLAAIFFSMILVNNYVLVKFYGICPFPVSYTHLDVYKRQATSSSLQAS